MTDFLQKHTLWNGQDKIALAIIERFGLLDLVLTVEKKLSEGIGTTQLEQE